jgi:hypothetical protein
MEIILNFELERSDLTQRVIFPIYPALLIMGNCGIWTFSPFPDESKKIRVHINGLF